MWLYHRVMSPNDAGGMAMSSLIRVYTVCPDLSVRKLRKITAGWLEDGIKNPAVPRDCGDDAEVKIWHLSPTMLCPRYHWPNWFWFDFCFTALQHILRHFGCGQLAYPHCSWASLLGSLPVLTAHSFAST